MTARWQRALLLLSGLLLLAVGAGLWPRSPVLALGVVLGLVLGQALWLALEFALMAWVARRQPGPRPGARTLCRAWWRELRAATVVFGLWQPWRAQAWPDRLQPGRHPGQRGLLLIHGYCCNRGVWTPWMRALHAQGRPFVALNLEPGFGSIDAHGDQVDRAVAELTRVTGLAPVLLAHSMGGLVARAWWRASAARGEGPRVHHVITLGTPHQGTWLARWAHTRNGRQMRLGSPWLQALAADEPAARARFFSCFYSDCDNIVFPSPVACLAGARAWALPGVPHLAMAVEAAPRARIMALIESLDAAPPAA